jgi:hypothetical protein
MAIKAAFAEEKDAGPVEAPSSDYDYSEMGYTEPVTDSEDAEASDDDIEIPEPEYASGPDDEPVTEKSEAEDEPAAEAEDSAEEETGRTAERRRVPTGATGDCQSDGFHVPGRQVAGYGTSP